jgi:hypothetical protein
MMFYPFSMIARGIPNLVVSRRVIEKMAAASRRYLADETGEALVGLVVPGTNTNGVPTLYVLDTISPDEDAVVRHAYTFQQGDELQQDMFLWLREHWELYRQQRVDRDGRPLAAKWDVPLRHLGDWHKQPGFMIQPSSGDRFTALNFLDDEEIGMDFLLAPIVTLGHPSTTSTLYSNANFITVPQGNGADMRVDFWYIDRSVRQFLPIIPALYPDDLLPGLPDYPWHLVNEARFNAEMALLKKDGLFTSLAVWNADGKPPLEVCLMTARMGADRVLIILTEWNYPTAAPTARTAPFIPMGPQDDLYTLMEQLWAQSEPVANPPGWQWSPEKHLLDYIRALEDHLGIPRPTPADQENDSIKPSVEAPQEAVPGGGTSEEAS